MRKNMKISGIGTGGMTVKEAAEGTEAFCTIFGIGYSSVIVGDTVLMTFDGPEVVVETIFKAQLQTAADFGMQAEEIYEN